MRVYLHLVVWIVCLHLSACTPQVYTYPSEVARLNQIPQNLPLLPTAGLLQSSRQGGSITLEAGIYLLDAPLRVEADVSILGAGVNKSILLSEAPRATITLDGPHRLRLDGVTVVHRSSQPADVIYSRGGQLELHNSRVMGGVRNPVPFEDSPLQHIGSGIRLLAEASLLLQDSLIIDNAQHGIAMDDGSSATVRNSSIWASGRNGIRARGTASFDLIASSVMYARSSGVNLFTAARGRVQASTIGHNAAHAVLLQELASIEVSNSNFADNGRAAIALFDASFGRLTQNDCRQNAAGGIVNASRLAQGTTDGGCLFEENP